ncbi:hypothetical protein AURDEDRAFT_178018 [Auricularia subglabra TFB-10046 SS5]|uniref:Uncharacterized protein n=1 Tax=Auricularia subglabra (strain TFB-10046 / SS5) TaxID=717982 RepID=J0L931_AURST|nr:hypothetical protein AURDEDRAFT_178018 [Auricularia subglabra TFB-10046 SS5]
MNSCQSHVDRGPYNDSDAARAIRSADAREGVDVPYWNTGRQTGPTPASQSFLDDAEDTNTDAPSSPAPPTVNVFSGDIGTSAPAVSPSDVEQTVCAFLDVCASGPLDPSVELPTILVLQNVSDAFAEAFLKPYYEAWNRQRNVTDAMRKQLEANVLDYIIHAGKYEHKRDRLPLRERTAATPEEKLGREPCPAPTTSEVGTPGQENEIGATSGDTATDSLCAK